jgi:hypothetical protein
MLVYTRASLERNAYELLVCLVLYKELCQGDANWLIVVLLREPVTHASLLLRLSHGVFGAGKP